MRIPLSWLNEHVELKDPSLDAVHAALVSVGFEEEDTHSFDFSGPIVVGEVLERTPEEHSNGKTINWCQVRVAPAGETAADGGADVRGIVCGAHNFEVGDKVITTLPGAVLPGNFQIAARKTYGHVSDGMLASARELGLGEDHDGIITLRRLGLDAPVGTPAHDVLGTGDSAVEINVTPDRGYAFSIRGVAREYSHATGAKFTDPAIELTARSKQSEFSGFPVKLDDQAPIRGRAGVQGFVVRKVTGVDQSRPTPQWMVARLLLAGQRPLSLAADISNYVMLELGNPLHAYDAAKVQGGLGVRRATAGETLVTLDGTTRKLDTEDLVIVDDSGVIGLAGVMGGESTKTTAETTEVLIEAATFDPVSIARSVRRHKLPSEAAKRFERSVDPLVAEAAAQRMVDLLVEYGGGSASAEGARLTAAHEPVTIELAADAPQKLVGVDYSAESITTALEMIGCEVAAVDGGYRVTAPSWRADLTRPADLIEEIARINGYDQIPSQLPVAPPGRGLTRAQQLRRRAANFAAAAGLTEVIIAPFVSQAQLETFAAEDFNYKVNAVRLTNPLDGQAPYLRVSLLPGLITAAQRNHSRGLVDVALVEFGSIFVAENGNTKIGTKTVPPMAQLPSPEVIAELNASLPDQPRMVAALMTGAAQQAGSAQTQRTYDWADALETARGIAWSFGAQLDVRQASRPGFHPGRTAELLLAGEVIGVAGELHPEVVAAAHLPFAVAALEMNLDKLIELAPQVTQAQQLSTMPAATQDVTLLVAADTPAAAVQTAFAAGAGDLLESVRLVDDYRGDSVREGEKALTFKLRFRAADRTLKAEEASEAKLQGVARAAETVGARLREV
ncbi:phenylalanine--tRNA ligase subunit beta [Canibacter zhoujuaniae]|uniref:phenylalanine--tRNA ligase subunit beta n=1 Tax=Canibacter zhoujuaniae TaxID=2708343 RepID=UPI00141F7E57|nr:phenylalanine--tRNA ligase subunit beta [Canibacter zhoujuaniae]